MKEKSHCMSPPLKKFKRLNKKIVWTKPQVWRTQFTSCSSVDMKIVTYFLFIFKTINITANNLMLFQYFFYLQNCTNFVIFYWRILFFANNAYRPTKMFSRVFWLSINLKIKTDPISFDKQRYVCGNLVRRTKK